MNKIIARIKGGIGNQLFCYAAARRLALVNKSELVIDDVSGFKRDRMYKRHYELDHFHIPVRKATPAERLEPFERYSRGILKLLSRFKSFAKKKYLEQEGLNFDKRILTIKPKKILHIDGYWQSELYFKDVEGIIRKDLQISPPVDKKNREMADLITHTNSICIHVRWFDMPNIKNAITTYNVDKSYYKNAITIMKSKVKEPHFFVFSDFPNETISFLSISEKNTTFISHNKDAYADLWLMSICKHFIIANSTFSWWGAWLSSNTNKIVIAPSETRTGVKDLYNSTGWIQV